MDFTILYECFQPLLKNGKPFGYVKSVKKLRHVTLRGASHMAPRSHPKASFDMFNDFLVESTQLAMNNVPPLRNSELAVVMAVVLVVVLGC